MQKTILTIVLATLCLNFSSKAQVQQYKIHPLKIGDSIPEALWNLPLQVVNHPEGKKTINLQEYRHKKLIILDFWATYCSPCIKSLHKLDTIQQKVGEDKLAVLPILVFDGAERAAPFIKTTDWHWPSVVNDTHLRAGYFSGYLTGFGTVWISEGKLLAVPKGKYVTTEKVLLAITLKPLHIGNRKEQPSLKP